MADFIRQSLWFPVIQWVHLIGLILLVGTISIVDMRMLGLALKRHAVFGLASGLAPWTMGGLIVMTITGSLMFWADASRYTINPAFAFKMVLLVLALAHHLTLHRTVAMNLNDSSGRARRLSAALSLALWSSVALAGRAIADFDIY